MTRRIKMTTLIRAKKVNYVGELLKDDSRNELSV